MSSRTASDYAWSAWTRERTCAVMVALRAMVMLAKGLVDSRLDERNAIEVRKGRPGWRGHREGETPADGDNPAGLDLEQAEARERRVVRMEASGQSFERSDSA
ncbi:hypothetical protein OsI_07339 [Oryza sativa Indica Group]|uniref:Uncharacterized protein n=1 Tax=Oryza sativa subsp. indica TaxID=39946 RepID=B8AIC4_ORYSI|nr:hypothetical protein OsI_07339 [Oryza sativa Indica Group]